MSLTTWFADLAWLPTGVAHAVAISADGARITAVQAGTAPPAGAQRLPGLVVPGLANAHSHAFHRALRGRTESRRGNFWSWREAMYAVAARLDPDRQRALARAVYAEMALAGITAVGEFHYVHHQPDGTPYDDPAVMQEALAEAAADAGVRITLLDTCYLRGGFDAPLDPAQRRFSDGDPERWAQRASARRAGPHVRLGAAIHSVRAVDGAAMEVVRDWAMEHEAPLHAHLSEQPAENEACLAHTGRRPAQLLDDHGVLSARTTAVHATHVDADDIARLAERGSGVCLCPTTERFLADGIGPAAALARAGTPLSVGSDSHAVIDLFEEARALELHERLRTGERGHFAPANLLEAASRSGMAALGWDAGEIAPGRLCDLVAIDLRTVRLAGSAAEHAAEAVVYAAAAPDVTHVVASGRPIVADRHHLLVDDVVDSLQRAIEEVSEP